ncbi:MAG TPA: hypothetical protein VGC42_04285, partial [Kofleriaceae bacterium]
IVLHGEHDRDLAVIAAGAIQIADVDAGDVLLLPPELTGIAAFTAIIAVGAQQVTTPGAIADSAAHHTLSLVIDPLALSAVALTPLAPPVTTSPPPRGQVSKRNHA